MTHQSIGSHDNLARNSGDGGQKMLNSVKLRPSGRVGAEVDALSRAGFGIISVGTLEYGVGEEGEGDEANKATTNDVVSFHA